MVREQTFLKTTFQVSGSTYDALFVDAVSIDGVGECAAYCAPRRRCSGSILYDDTDGRCTCSADSTTPPEDPSGSVSIVQLTSDVSSELSLSKNIIYTCVRHENLNSQICLYILYYITILYYYITCIYHTI